MTENEAIKVLNDEDSYGYELNKACLIAIQALEEIQQYRTIGTVEELKELKDEQQNKCKDCAGCTIWKCDCANERNNAIDEFAKELNKKVSEFVLQHKDNLDFASGISVAWIIIDETTEQMKAGGTDGNK